LTRTRKTSPLATFSPNSGSVKSVGKLRISTAEDAEDAEDQKFPVMKYLCVLCVLRG
jgi:hypothetical protein